MTAASCDPGHRGGRAAIRGPSGADTQLDEAINTGQLAAPREAFRRGDEVRQLTCPSPGGGSGGLFAQLGGVAGVPWCPTGGAGLDVRVV